MIYCFTPCYHIPSISQASEILCYFVWNSCVYFVVWVKRYFYLKKYKSKKMNVFITWCTFGFFHTYRSIRKAPYWSQTTMEKKMKWYNAQCLEWSRPNKYMYAKNCVEFYLFDCSSLFVSFCCCCVRTFRVPFAAWRSVGDWKLERTLRQEHMCICLWHRYNVQYNCST